MKSSNIRYIPTVDHLRAFAAALVVFYHGMQLFGSFSRTNSESFDRHWTITKNPLLALVAEGHSAVALFLVLSGFIFTYGAAGRDISYWQFLANRMWRIAPLFFLVIIFGIHVYPENFSILGFLQTLAFLGDLPGGIQAGALTNNTWSVGIEFRCYFVFPFLLHFVERYGLRYVLGVLLVTLLFRCLHFFNYDRAEDIAYWTIVGRLDQFVIGMATAIVYRRLEGHKRVLRWMLPAAVAAVLAGLEWFNSEGGFPADNWHRIFWPSIEGCFWAFLVLTYVSFDRGDGRTGNWVSAVVARLGQISFSTYLLHFPVIALLIHRRWMPHLSTDPNDNGLLATLLVAWPLSIAVSALTYNVVERPFMSYRKRYIQPEGGAGPLPRPIP